MSNFMKFAEVTGSAMMLVALPVGYYYGRPYIFGA